MKKSDWKKFWKKFWFVVWKDDSPKGWIISLVFLFIVIKLIFFPLMSLVTGTSLPLVIVESCSMYHEDNFASEFDEWWVEKEFKYFKVGISKNDWKVFPFKKGFNKGDILFITGVKPEKVELGDVIIFEADYKNPIIHRVVSINEKENGFYFSTLGDNNEGQLEIEKNIYEDQVVGKARANVAPYIGWIKLGLFERMKPFSERGLCKNQ
ncbi:MAG: signal peptidase I [Nanoarchaeota archaeon]|nr:signal peptidase I [Nanoarchaeota archaeon]